MCESCKSEGSCNGEKQRDAEARDEKGFGAFMGDTFGVFRMGVLAVAICVCVTVPVGGIRSWFDEPKHFLGGLAGFPA